MATDEPGIYGLIAIMVTEAAALAVLWIKSVSNGRETKANGDNITKTGAGLRALAERITELERDMKILEQNRDEWQLRALTCEDRERRRPE